jgi:hypothetical protein
LAIWRWLTERLITALESAADDSARPEEERGRFRQAARMLAGLGCQVAVGALGDRAGVDEIPRPLMIGWLPV